MSDPAPPPLEKPSLKREGFVIKDGVITCNGFERVDSDRLAKLFHPERAGATQRTQKKYVDEAKKLFKKSFLAAQLRFYGITFPRGATEAQLRSLLDKAVAASQCIHVPASVVALHKEMRAAYCKEAEAWKKAVQDWETQWALKQDEAWARLETPSERASHDLTRFMEHYFLTNGVPDPAKKPEPLALYNFTEDQVIADLRQRAAKIPGLEVVSAGRGPDHAICVGWERTSVFSLAGEIENLAREKQKKRVEAEWEKAMQDHKKFVVKASPPAAVAAAAAPTPPPPPPLPPPPQSTDNSAQIHLRLACGSFVLQCKAVTDKYHDLPGLTTKLSLDVSDGPANNGDTLRAGVDLGVFHGTAILSFSQPVLDWFVKRYDKTALAAAASVYEKSGKHKRKSSDAQYVQEERPRKQRKFEDPKPGRIFLRMRGSKAIDGRICADIQHGYLDFLDAAWTKFQGVIDVPGVGEDIEVEGFRVAQEAAFDPPPWNAYWPEVRDASDLSPAS
ncbi:unnamed protein product [Discula destructiva]